MKNKSALKKRTQMMLRKENIQRRKLNEKMARIEELHNSKEERRQSLIESRYSRSPKRTGTTTTNPIVNFVSLGQG